MTAETTAAALASPDENETVAEPTPLHCRFYRTMRARAQNGHVFTMAEIEDLVEQDPPTKHLFEQLAKRSRAGEDFTVGELAELMRAPESFVVFLVRAFISNYVAALQVEALERDQSESAS